MDRVNKDATQGLDDKVVVNIMDEAMDDDTGPELDVLPTMDGDLEVDVSDKRLFLTVLLKLSRELDWKLWEFLWSFWWKFDDSKGKQSTKDFLTELYKNLSTIEVNIQMSEENNKLDSQENEEEETESDAPIEQQILDTLKSIDWKIWEILQIANQYKD